MLTPEQISQAEKLADTILKFSTKSAHIDSEEMKSLWFLFNSPTMTDVYHQVHSILRDHLGDHVDGYLLSICDQINHDHLEKMRNLQAFMRARHATEPTISQLQADLNILNIKYQQVVKENLGLYQANSRQTRSENNAVKSASASSDLKIRINEKETEVNDLKNLISQKETEINDLKNLICQKETEVNDLKSANNALEERVKELEGKPKPPSTLSAILSEMMSSATAQIPSSPPLVEPVSSSPADTNEETSVHASPVLSVVLLGSRAISQERTAITAELEACRKALSERSKKENVVLHASLDKIFHLIDQTLKASQRNHRFEPSEKLFAFDRVFSQEGNLQYKEMEKQYLTAFLPFLSAKSYEYYSKGSACDKNKHFEKFSTDSFTHIGRYRSNTNLIAGLDFMKGNVVLGLIADVLKIYHDKFATSEDEKDYVNKFKQYLDDHSKTLILQHEAPFANRRMPLKLKK